MSISFRKIIAVCLLIVLVWPLLFGSLTLLSINSWVLDRNFYVNLLDDPRLYEAMVSQDLPLYMNTRWFPGAIDSALPPAALDRGSARSDATGLLARPDDSHCESRLRCA